MTCYEFIENFEYFIKDSGSLKHRELGFLKSERLIKSKGKSGWKLRIFRRVTDFSNKIWKQEEKPIDKLN